MMIKPPGSFRVHLTAAACLLLLPLKLIQGWRSVPALALLSSWAADAGFLALLCAIGLWAGGVSRTRRVVLGGAVLVLVEFPVFIVISAHTYFLQDSIGRRWALLDASPSLIRYFFVEVVPRNVLVSAGAVLAALCAAAWVASRRWRTPSAGAIALASLVLGTGLYFDQLRYDFYPSVLQEIGADIVEIASHPPVAGPVGTPDLANAGIGYPARWPARSRFDRIILFVMESVPLNVLEAETPSLPPNGFFARARTQTHSYTDFFTTNMDSRTGLMSMMFSRLVPYEAYTEEDVKHYGFMRDERSFIDDLAAQGFATALAVAEIDEDVVIHELPSWQRKLMITHDEYDHAKGYLCLNPYEFEQGCEDKILLPKTFAELDAHPRGFLLQEAVYGHDEEYERTLKKTPVQYYDEHLAAIRDHLAARGELDRTLFVITSDHGPRGAYDSTRRLSYRLPLLFINPSFERDARPAMYSQSDFAALLAAEMAGDPPPPARQTVLFVGPTNTSILGSVTTEGDLLVVRNRPWSRYILVNGHCPTDQEPGPPPARQVGSAALVERFLDLRRAYQPGLSRTAASAPPAKPH